MRVHYSSKLGDSPILGVSGHCSPAYADICTEDPRIWASYCMYGDMGEFLRIGRHGEVTGAWRLQQEAFGATAIVLAIVSGLSILS